MAWLRDKKACSRSAKVNRAVIVTVSKFDHGVDMDRRPGTKTDTKRLHSILSKLGFQVKIEEENLRAEEIYQVFQEGKTDLSVLYNILYARYDRPICSVKCVIPESLRYDRQRKFVI